LLDTNILKDDVYLQPGYICLPARPTKLFTVVGAGIVVTLYDTKKKYGGMNYYVRPKRVRPEHSTPEYACPAIIGLLAMLLKHGSKLEDLEAHMYGGASNSNMSDHIEGLSDDNIKIGFEILDHKKIRIAGKDIGGDRGRKVVFNTSTGETIVAKVDKIRSKDWYPEVLDCETESFGFK